MSDLIEELKEEHAVITGNLNRVKSLGIASQEGLAALLAAKNGLLGHLKKEDDLLYPVLHAAAESDDNLKKTLNVFAKDMAGISKAALEFFEKYSAGGSGLEFAEDCGRLFATISLRIGKEENVLYQKYELLK